MADPLTHGARGGAAAALDWVAALTLALALAPPSAMDPNLDTAAAESGPEQVTAPTATATASTSKKRNFSALAAVAQEASDGTLPVLGYQQANTPSPAPTTTTTGTGTGTGTGKKTPKVSKRGKRDDTGNDLWDAELDKVLRTGMTILPNMGRRTIWLEDDEQSYGRNGLLGEYIRRQTGKVRNRTQVASHLAVLRKNNPDDHECQSVPSLSLSLEIQDADTRNPPGSAHPRDRSRRHA